jgi:hypothetical protein
MNSDESDIREKIHRAGYVGAEVDDWLEKDSDTAEAVRWLKEISQSEHRHRFTPPVAIELARMLCYLGGGDGRGVYEVIHRPWGDRIQS